MIKKIIAMCAVCALMISAAGCVGVGFTSYHGSERNGDIQGSGEMVSQSFPCDDFSSLTIKIPGELYYTVGKAGVTIELHENLVEHIVFSNVNGSAVIDASKNISVKNDRDVPKIYVSTPSLEYLDIEGLIHIKEMDTITADAFELDIDGVCNGKIDLAVKNLTIGFGGVGNLVLTGTADNANIDMSGVGSLKAFDLLTKVAEIDSSGVGGAEISCSEKLIVDISGIGGIQYKGECTVQPNISGMGGLKKVD